MQPLPSPERSLLAYYRLPERRFEPSSAVPAPLRPIWEALHEGRTRDAQTNLRRLLEELPAGSEDAASLRAAVLYGLAAASIIDGHPPLAQRYAEESLATLPRQWASHRILLELLEANQAYEKAYLYLSDHLAGPAGPGWDAPLPEQQQYLAAAAWTWQIGDWEAVANFVSCAYPDGLVAMPADLQEDCFRLALYRQNPDEAAEAAACLITNRSIESADELLQTIVHQGWTEQALPLYRSVYANAPGNELLRRRLIALCIREGIIDEARRLSSLGVLKAS